MLKLFLGVFVGPFLQKIPTVLQTGVLSSTSRNYLCRTFLHEFTFFLTFLKSHPDRWPVPKPYWTYPTDPADDLSTMMRSIVSPKSENLSGCSV
jgi:hypothetical protein